MTTTPIVVSATSPRPGRARTYRSASTISAIGDRVETDCGNPGGSRSSMPQANALVAADRRNTPPTPNHDRPISAPARAGAITRIASCVVWLSVTAGPMASGSTTSAMNAMRAGRNSANAVAWIALATSSIQYSITSATTARPISNDVTTSNETETNSTLRFENLSAATPPHGVAMSIAIPNASITPPNPVLFPVRSRASHPRATAWPMTPKITAAEAYSSLR